MLECTCRVQGYPTIKAWVNGKAKGAYNGDRSAGAIKNWALGLLPNHVATVNKQQQVWSTATLTPFVRTVGRTVC